MPAGFGFCGGLLYGFGARAKGAAAGATLMSTGARFLVSRAALAGAGAGGSAVAIASRNTEVS